MNSAGASSLTAWDRIDAAAAFFANGAGWRRHAAAFALGAAATLSLPPLDLLPFQLLALTGLVWLLPESTPRRRSAFAAGWWFGFGYFAVGLYWIGNALLVFADRHAWLLPFAALGLPAFLAFFTGAATLAASLARGNLARALALAAALAAADWLRGHVLTGLPWNLFGHAWTGLGPLLQSAAVYGIYGTGLVALVAAALPAGLAGGNLRRRAAVAVAVVAILAAHGAWGALRLEGAPAPGEAVVEGVGLRIVQADIPQREKWRRDLRGRNIARHLALSREDRPDWITHVIWAETAATLFLEDDPGVLRVLARAVPPGGLLLTGAPRRQQAPYRVFNSAIAIDGAGTVVGRYDKAHLVPFGEYVPLASVLPLEMITHGSTGYSAGPGPRTLDLPGLPPASLSICYEAIFPGGVVDPAARPGVMINLTNDAWYGATAGPHQHFAITRVRAVEQGIPLVRVAYTGISGLIDGHGRVLATLGLNNRGYLDLRLPVRLKEKPIYARLGDTVFAGLLLIVSVLAVLLHRR